MNSINSEYDDEQIDEIATFIVPLAQRSLLLPNVSVAEIIPHRLAQVVEDAPVWFKGFIDWRGLSVPLISFDLLNEQANPEANLRENIAVINSVSGAQDLPFFAILSQGSPRLMRIAEEDITTIDMDAGSELGPAELMFVSVHGKHASIPNIDYVEDQIRQHIELA